MAKKASSAQEKGLAKYFEFSKHGTSYRTEFIAGLTTFLAMAYILVVNPLTLKEAGMDFGAVFTATAIASILGTLVMALYAKYPIALAPGMGLNAFFAFSVVIGMGIPWEQALAGVFISGILALILSISGIRETVINAIPQGLKHAVAAGIGLFISFIGFKNAGIIVPNDATFVGLGSFTNSGTLLALFGVVITVILLARKIQAAVFYGILITTVAGLIFQIIPLPSGIVDVPPNPSGLGAFFAPLMDVSTIFSPTMLVVIFTLVFVDFFDTAGTLVGVASQAGLIKDNKLPRIGRALVADSSATIIGSVVGTSNTTSYIESAAGVGAGGRTGFTSLITAGFFLVALFFFPVLSVITAEATAAALIVVGILMAASIAKIEWDKFDEAAPAFITVIAMPLTFSIASGLALGFILYPLLKLVKGEGKKVHWIMYLLAVVFIIYFAVLREM